MSTLAQNDFAELITKIGFLDVAKVDRGNWNSRI